MPGTYTIEYKICQVGRLTNCASAIETVVIADTTIAAGPEADRPLTGSDTAQGAGNVLNAINDTLNGIAAVPGPGGTVRLTIDTISPQLSVNTATGAITLAAGAAAGTYTVTYRICEIGNLRNCAIATETVVVTDNVIAAGPEAARPVTGSDTAVTAGSVLSPANDTLNGAAAVPGAGGNVVLSLVAGANSDAELSLNPATGIITVAAGTAAGTYTIEYRICEAARLTNCATAIETVIVTDRLIEAGPEADRPLFGADAAQNAGNVLSAANDRLAGVAAVPGAGGTVVLTISSISPALTLDTATGALTLVGGTLPGTYTVTYQICEVGNADNCAAATETVVVTNRPIAATGITFPAFNGALGGTTPTVTANDDLNGAAPTPGPGGSVVLTVVTPATDPNITLNPATGIITVAPGTPPGTYPITYKICEALNLTNCATATETVIVASIAAVSEVFPTFTADGGTTTSMLASDLFSGGPAGLANVTLTVLAADAGATLNTSTALITLATGQAAGSYTVTYQICSIAVPTLCSTAIETVTQAPLGKLEADKTATVSSGNPNAAEGDTVTFTIKVTNRSNVAVTGLVLTDAMTTTAGTPVVLDSGPTFVSADAASPEGALLVGETAQYTGTIVITRDIALGGGLANTVTANAFTAAGFPGGPIAVTADSAARVSALPPAPSGKLTVEKTTPRGVVERGAAVPYTITVRNADTTAGQTVILDLLPPGFLYIAGSATLDGVAVDINVQGRVLRWPLVTVPANGEVVATVIARVTTGAQPGDHVNTARLLDATGSGVIAPEATATVRIMPEPVFDCGDVIGKVYDDANRDGYQNQGETGIPAVRIAGVDGTIITTDQFGRFHVPCAMLPVQHGSNFILKLDTRTLPSGFRVTTENPRMVRLTPGKMTEMNFGAAITRVVRLDLNARAFVAGAGNTAALAPKLIEGIAKLLPQIADQAVNLRLAYHVAANAPAADVAQARALMGLVEKHIRKEWRHVGQVKLTIETTIVRGAE